MVRVGLPKGGLLNKSRVLASKICKCNLKNAQLFAQNFKYQFFFFKHRDIPFLLANGSIDVGITSEEWLVESQITNIEILHKLNWCHTKLALITSTENKIITSCATEFTSVAKAFFGDTDVSIIKTHGSSEAFVPTITDSCIDCIETGATLKDNKLIIRQVIMESDIVFLKNSLKKHLDCSEIFMFLEEVFI